MCAHEPHFTFSLSEEGDFEPRLARPDQGRRAAIGEERLTLRRQQAKGPKGGT